MKSIEKEYISKHPESKNLYEEAKVTFPSGVTHDVRYMKPFPVFMTHGQGPRKWDVDGNEYIDYVMGHGSIILGHSHPEIVTAVNRQIAMGTHLGSNTEMEIRWARAVKSLMPSIERIRFHSSGTEATLMALRLARAFTGKNKIVKFKDHFHGWHDYVIAELGKHSSTGIPDTTEQSMIRLSAGDIEIIENLLKKDKDIAGVILEPTGAMMGCMPIRQEFIIQLRELTERYKVLLIFDEVVTGFRISSGGAQKRFNIKPDLTTLAKILAGGLPGGAVGGKAEIMELISFHDDHKWDTSRRISHSGTFNGNPISAAAGSRCLELIASQPINQQADNAAAPLTSGLNQILKNMGIPGFAYCFSSLVWVLFGMDYEGDPTFCTLPHEQIKEAIVSQTAQIFKCAMLNAGVDIMGTGKFIVSATHRDDDIEETLSAFEKAITQMRNEDVF